MQDIINSFKAHLYERTSSPLLGAFLFYWIIFNYKLLIIIFSSLEPIQKFNEITSSVYPTWLEQWGNGLIFPAVTTLIYILYFPKISNKIHKKWIEHQNELKSISNGTVYTKKEFGDLQRKFTALELSFDDIFKKKDDEINNLKIQLDNKNKLLLNYEQKLQDKEVQYTDLDLRSSSWLEQLNECNSLKSEQEMQIHNLNNDISKLKEEVEKLNPLGLDENDISVLKFIGEYLNGIDSLSIKQNVQLHQVKVDNTIKKLLDNDYIIQKNDYINHKNYTKYLISENGKIFLLNNNYI